MLTLVTKQTKKHQSKCNKQTTLQFEHSTKDFSQRGITIFHLLSNVTIAVCSKVPVLCPLTSKDVCLHLCRVVVLQKVILKCFLACSLFKNAFKIKSTPETLRSSRTRRNLGMATSPCIFEQDENARGSGKENGTTISSPIHCNASPKMVRTIFFSTANSSKFKQ